MGGVQPIAGVQSGPKMGIFCPSGAQNILSPMASPRLRQLYTPLIQVGSRASRRPLHPGPRLYQVFMSLMIAPTKTAQCKINKMHSQQS